MISNFCKKIRYCCCFTLTNNKDDNYTAFNDKDVIVINSTNSTNSTNSPNSPTSSSSIDHTYSLSDEPVITYNQIYK